MEYVFESIHNYLQVIFYSILIGYSSFIWLNTNALYEYTKYILKPTKLYFNYESFLTEKNLVLSVSQYIKMTRTNFAAKILTCPLCLTFWCSVLLFRSKEAIVAAFISYLSYKLLEK